ncbi:hypothetical protein PilKf_00138 [Pillotina sp. SPG140]
MKNRKQETGNRKQETGNRKQETGKSKKSRKSAQLLFFSVLFCLTFNLSAQNNQKIIPIDSEIYQAIKSLYITQGLALPSTAGPWSQDELLLMLNRLDTSRLNSTTSPIYTFVLNQVQPSNKAFQFKGDVALQMFAHTNPAQFVSSDVYIRHPNRTEPLLNLNFDFFLTKYGYGHFEFPLMGSTFGEVMAAPHRDVTVPQSFMHNSHGFGVNIPFLVNSMSNFDASVPFRTVVSAGGEGWNIQIGRDRLSWGPGESGNFLVGDHVRYHSGARATFYGSHLKYIYNVSSFPYPGEYYFSDPDTGEIHRWVPSNISTSADGTVIEVMPESFDIFGLNLFIAHRLEWRLFRNKLGFALNEAIIYQTAKGVINPDALLPSMILHSLYRKGNQNSLLTLEADFSPIPLLNFYGLCTRRVFSFNRTENGSECNERSKYFRIYAGSKNRVSAVQRDLFCVAGICTNLAVYVLASPKG